jgi:hypothetical protein
MLEELEGLAPDATSPRRSRCGSPTCTTRATRRCRAPADRRASPTSRSRCFGPVGSIVAALTCPYTQRLDKLECPEHAGDAGNARQQAGREISQRVTSASGQHAHPRYPPAPGLPGSLLLPLAVRDAPAARQALARRGLLRRSRGARDRGGVAHGGGRRRAHMRAETEFVLTSMPRNCRRHRRGAPGAQADFAAQLEQLTAIRGRQGHAPHPPRGMPDELSSPTVFAENLQRLAGYGT